MYDLFKKRALYSSALIALLVLSGCSSSDGESSSDANGGVVVPSSKASGPVVDGYIAGGHLYADLDGSKDENSGDITTTTDAQGNFSFGETTIAHGTYLYVTGGTDLATNAPFTGELSAYFFGENTVISPLSTLIVSLMQNEGLSYEEAKTRAASMMGLTEEQLVSDPFAEPIDTAVFIASQRIVSVANTLGGDFSTAVDALASSNMDIAAAAGALVPPVDPSDAEAVDAYLVDLEGQMPANATPDDLAAYQMILTDAISDPSNIPSADASAAVVNAIRCVIFDAIKGSNIAENNVTSNLVLDSCEAVDDNVTFAWSSDNAALISPLDGSLIRPVYIGGSVNLSITVTSDADSSVSADTSFSLTVPRLDNHPPVAVDDLNTTDEDMSTSFNVLTNDSDADGDTLTLVAVSNGVSFSADGTVNYTPAQDFNGDFDFEYTVKDSWGDEVNGTATVNVTAVNDAPVIDVISEQTVTEDFVTATLDVSASDVENDALTYSIISVEPAIINASFIVANNNTLTLTSIADLYGDSNITVMVDDGDKNDTKTFTVHVTAVDDAPVINPISNPVPIDEDSIALNINYNVSDIDTAGLTLAVSSSNSAIATAVISGSDIVVTPQPDMFGIVTITLSADDGNTLITADFNVTINSVDDAPVLDPLAAKTIDEDDGTYNIWPSPHATDIDNDDAGITYSIVSSDTSILTTNGLQYTTVPDAYGTVDINVTATSNGLTDSKILTVTVRAIDDAPVIASINDITVAEDNGVITVTPSATDVDNNDSDITFTYVSSDPLVVSDGTAISTVTDANGVATITVTAHSNGRAASTDFNVTVTAVNDAPTADSFLVPVVTGTTGVQIDLSSHIDDVDGDTLTVTAFDALDGLSLNPDERSFTFDSNGTEDSFVVNYTVADPDGLSANAVMTITVSATPIHPEANPLVASMQEDTSLSIDLLTPNVDATSIVSASGTDGAVTIETNGTITFIPTANFNGMAVINYTVASATADQNSSTVTVTVNNVNDAPVIQVRGGTLVSATESNDVQYIGVDLNITDVDVDTVTLTSVISSDTAIADIVGQSLTTIDLSIPAYANGIATITIEVTDGQISTQSTFDVNVTAVSSMPYLYQSTMTIDLANGGTSALLKDLVGPSNEAIDYALQDAGDAGIAVVDYDGAYILGAQLTFDPVSSGTTDIIIRATNHNDTSLVADLVYTIHVYDSANVPPVAAPSEITVEADGSIQTMLDVHDDNGDYLTFTYPTPPMNGTVLSVDGWNGQITYAAKNGFIGDDSFTYIAHDDQNASNEVTVTVHVTAAENNNDNGDQTSMPISLDTFNGYTALSANGVGMFQPDDQGDNGVVDMHLTKILTDDGSSVIHIYDNGVFAQDLPFAYEINGDNTMSVDEDGDTVVDFVVKYLGTATKTEIETDLNFTLPAGSSGYKLATMNPQADYDFWDEPVYADWNNTTNQGYNPYSSLDDYIADNTFDPNNPDWQHNVWIDGYEFMLESNGTIIRAVNYYDQANSQQDWYVTNPNAGSWERVSVDVDGDGSDDDVVEIRPTAYGLTTVRLAMVDTTDGYVHEGEYQSAGRSELEYWFDENTAYHIGNSIMNVDVNVSYVDVPEASAEFTSFNASPTSSMLLDEALYSISTNDWGTYTIEMETITFDSNGSAIFGDGSSMPYSLDGANEVATLLNGTVPMYDTKISEVITNDPTAIEEATGLVGTGIFDASSVMYKFMYVSYNDEFDSWDSSVTALDGTTTYANYSAFETAFMNGELALDYTQNGTGIGYASGLAGVGGVLAEYQPDGTLVNDNVGTWEVKTIDTESVLVFNVTIARNGDNDAAGVSEDCGNQVCQGEFAAANSGELELNFDSATANVIVQYLSDENSTGNPIMLSSSVDINRDVEVVAFTNEHMYSATRTGEHNVTTDYVWLDGTSGPNSSGSFVLSWSSENNTYTSTDGLIAIVNDGTDDILKVKVNEELDAAQLMAETHLFLPPTARGYRVTHMELDTGKGGIEIRFDDATVRYLESYYYNNDFQVTIAP